MNNSLTHSKSQRFRRFNTPDAVESIKIIVFSIANLKLALRIQSVYKVLSQTPVHGSGRNNVGIAHIGDLSVTVVDLERQLFQSSSTEETPLAGYLIIAQNTRGEPYGIPVTAVPTLMDIPLSSISVLPESYRNADILGIASHICQITGAQTAMTIFLLDLDRL